MKTAAIYARFSSDMQREESIDAQIRACKYFAQKSEYDVIKVYADKAQSGKFTNKRDQFNMMLADARHGLFDTILVHKLNRFSRSGKDTLNLMDDLQDIGVEIVSVTERLDNTPEGRLMLYVIAGMNEFYSANLATEVLKGLKENAYSCKHTGGTAPLGYNVNADGYLEINTKEAEAVRMIFDMYLAGHGYTAIITALNNGGYFTKRGLPFGKNSLYEILKNEKYTGSYIYNRTCSATRNGKRNRHKYKSESDVIKIENAIPQIIPKEMFEEVQKKMKANQHKAAMHKAKADYLLSGKIFCGHCGCAMTGETRRYRGHEYGYYVCNDSRLKRGCSKKNIRQERIEAAVIEHLQNTLFNPEAIENISKRIYNSMHSNTSDDIISKYLAEIKETDRKINNTMSLIIDCPDIPELKEKLAQLSAYKKDLKIKIAELKTVDSSEKKTLEEIKQDFTLNTRLENYPYEDLKRVIDWFVYKIYVYDDPDGGHRIRAVITPSVLARSKVIEFLDLIGAVPSPPIKSKNKVSYLDYDIMFLDFFVE